MASKVALSANHRRNLSATLRAIEEAIDEMEDVINSSTDEKITKTVQKDMTDEERKKIVGGVQQLRSSVNEMFFALGLERRVVSENRFLGARVTHIWSMLLDSTPEELKGYGSLPPELASLIEQHLEKMLKIVEGME